MNSKLPAADVQSSISLWPPRQLDVEQLGACEVEVKQAVDVKITQLEALEGQFKSVGSLSGQSEAIGGPRKLN